MAGVAFGAAFGALLCAIISALWATDACLLFLFLSFDFGRDSFARLRQCCLLACLLVIVVLLGYLFAICGL